MKNSTIYILLSLSLLLIQCKKTKETPTENKVNFMVSSINGEEWKSDDNNSIHIFMKKDTIKSIRSSVYFPPKYKYSGLGISFCRKEKDGNSSMITIDIDSFYSPIVNNYSFDVKYPRLPYAFYMPTIDNDDYLLDLLVYGNTKGNVKITNIDLTNKRISGSFDFSQKADGYLDYNIKGQFENIEYIEKR